MPKITLSTLCALFCTTFLWGQLTNVTDVTLTFTPVGGGATVTVSATDADGDGAGVFQPSGSIDLLESTEYTLSIDVQNSIDGVNQTNVINGDLNSYMFFFGFTDLDFTSPADDGNITNRSNPINYGASVDGNGLPVGLSTSWETECAIIATSGSFQVRLQYQPGGIKTATSTAQEGTNEFDITWDVNILTDPNAPPCENEEEIITDVVLTFTPIGGLNTITAAAQDPDGEGPLPIAVDGAINLVENTTYEMSITLTNSIAGEDITTEIMEEDDEHQFFFSFSTGIFSSPTGDGNIDNRDDPVNYNDFDAFGLPVGLTTNWTTLPDASAGSGSFRVLLKHQPGEKSATTTSQDGGTDVDLTWNLNVVPQPVITVSGVLSSQTWTSDNTYLLDGYVSVPNGQTLTINPGTIIKGGANPTDPTNTAAALVICQGGRLNAVGNADSPIIFTAEADDLSDPFDLGQFATGLWGGVIVLGRSPLNSPAGSTPVTDLIEGINPASGTCRTFGGSDANDNSGNIQFVSIRHGGAELQPNDEINGLTLGGVGRGTVVSDVEVYANDDDGIEWFGGTVDVKNASVAFVSDDSYDYDQGWNGRGQFWFSIGDNAAGSNRAGEHDGATSPESAQPFTTPNISNATYIGKGIAPQGEPEIILFRDNAGGRYANSIFCESNTGLRVELNFNEPLSSNTQLQAGNLEVLNGAFGGGTLFIPSIAFNIAPNNQDPTNTAQANQLALARNVAAGSLTAFNNDLAQTCPIGAVGRTDNSGSLDPRTTSSKPASFTGNFADPFFQQVGYIGAFEPGSTAGGSGAGNFWADWTYLAERNIFIAALQR